MALITLPQTITKGTAFTVTLSKSDLFGLSCVLSHPHFGLQANLSKCIITYTANIPGAEIPETKILQFDLSENSPTASMYVSTHGMDTFTISEILIVDKDGGGLDVPAAQIPSGTDVSFLYLSVTSSAGTIDNTRPTISGIATPFVVVTITDGTHTGTVISVGDSSWSFQVPSAWGWSNQNSYTVTTSIVGASPVVQNFNVLSSFVTIATSGTVTTLTPTISGTTTNNTLVTLTSGSHSGTTTSNGSGAWSYSVPSSWSLSDDTTYTISAAVVGASASTSITTELRYVSITTSGGTITTLTPSLSGTATRNSTVTLSDGTHSATVTATAGGLWTYSVPGSWGWTDLSTHTVSASVSGASAASVTFTSELRYVTISTSGTLNSKTPTISGTATRNSTVTISEGSNSATTVASGSGSWSYSVPSGWALPNLTNVTFSAAVSGTSAATKSLYVDYPFVTIATSGTVTTLTPTITGTADASVSVTVSDGTHSGTTTSDSSGNWSFTVPSGWAWTDVTTFSVTASYGGASASTSITTELRYVTFTTTSGTITTLTPSLSGTATRNSTVTISDGTHSATVTASSSGAWSYSVSGSWGWADVTSFTVTASVSGATQASVSLTTELRYVTISTTGTLTTKTPTISGTATRNSTVTITQGSNSATTTASGSGAWSYTVPSGWNLPNLTNVTFGAAVSGATSASKSLATNYPFVTIATSGTVTSLTPVITGTSNASVSVTVSDGTHSGTATSDGSGNWSFTVPGSWSWTDVTSFSVTASYSGASASTSITTELRYVTISTAAGTITTLTPSLSGTATRNSTVTISDGTNSATVTATSGNSWSYSVPGTWGWVDVTAYAVTASVSGATSASVAFTTELRYVTISTSGTQNTATPTLTGTATRNSTVTITQGSNSATVTATSGGSWSYTVPSGWNLPNLTNVTFGAAVSGATSASATLYIQYQSAFLVAATGAGVIIKRGSGNYVGWGLNFSGNLGNGTTTTVARPTVISYSKDFDLIKGSSNEYHGSAGTVALESGTGYAYGWGANNFGDLGNGSRDRKTTPTAASGTHQFSQISYGLGANISNSASFYALAIEKSTGTLYSWGTLDNYTGSLARSVTNYWAPVAASNASSIAFKKVYAGGRALGISTSGALYMWGGGSSGSNNTPVLIDNSRVYNDIAATEPGLSAANMACFALDSTGTIYSWTPSGCSNPSGVLGNGSSSTQSTPTAIGGSKKFSQIATGREFVAAIEVGTNNLYTWGLNNYGQLGDGTLYTRFSPTLIGSRQWASVSCGDYFMVAVELGTNDVYTWGFGDSNRLGNGSSSSVLVPTKITMP